ncbi:MAG: TRAP transporter small permease [Desulfobacterales bacterium]|nr:TRAP transporter small permease [Desulfobacterales bacterium]
MKIFVNWLNKFEEATSSVALSLMAIIIILQVFQRYVVQHSLDWPEELARYLFIYSVYVGASYAALGRRHLEVTIVRTIFGKKIGKLFTILAYSITVVFCGLMFVWGIKMVLFVIESNQLAPALQFPMYIAYICIPLGFLLMGIRTLWVIWKLLSEELNS